MHTLLVFPESWNPMQRIGVWKVAIYFSQEPPHEVITLSRSCGQPAVIVEVTFAQPARKKALLACNERARIERGRTEIDQFAIDEVADFDGSNRRLRKIGDDANVNR